MGAPELVFFTAGHGLYNFKVSQDSFDRSLYYNLLLQPGLACSDHFLLQGSYVKNHLSLYEENESWIEVALKEKILVPHFRNDNAKFGDLYKHMQATGLHGLNPHSGEIAKRLDNANTSKRYWPSYMVAERYYSILEKYLSEESPPHFKTSIDDEDRKFMLFWERIDEWRLPEIQKAAEWTQAKPGSHGIQISELINVTSERLFEDKSLKIESVSDLISYAKKKRISHEMIEDIEIYYSIICEIYNQNLAEAFAASSNSPVSNNYITSLHLWKGNLLNKMSEESRKNIDSNEVHHNIKLPSLKTIRQTNGYCIVDIRERPAAQNYFQALKNWKSLPNGDNESKLLSALDSYARLICKAIGNEIAPNQFRASIISRTSALAGIFTAITLPVVMQTVVPAEHNLVAPITPLAAFAVSMVTDHLMRESSLELDELDYNLLSNNPGYVQLEKDLTVIPKEHPTIA